MHLGYNGTAFSKRKKFLLKKIEEKFQNEDSI